MSPVHFCIADSVMHIVCLSCLLQIYKQGGIHNKLLTQQILLYTCELGSAQYCVLLDFRHSDSSPPAERRDNRETPIREGGSDLWL